MRGNIRGWGYSRPRHSHYTNDWRPL